MHLLILKIFSSITAKLEKVLRYGNSIKHFILTKCVFHSDAMSSGFVTEKEIDEQKKARQEEWERVRKPDDPEIAPEVPYDPRSLFEQLEEHRIRKQDEWDESHKLKNQIRGLGMYQIFLFDS